MKEFKYDGFGTAIVLETKEEFLTDVENEGKNECPEISINKLIDSANNKWNMFNVKYVVKCVNGINDFAYVLYHRNEENGLFAYRMLTAFPMSNHNAKYIQEILLSFYNEVRNDEEIEKLLNTDKYLYTMASLRDFKIKKNEIESKEIIVYYNTLSVKFNIKNGYPIFSHSTDNVFFTEKEAYQHVNDILARRQEHFSKELEETTKQLNKVQRKLKKIEKEEKKVIVEVTTT